MDTYKSGPNCTPKELRAGRHALISARIIEERRCTPQGTPTKDPWVRINFQRLLEALSSCGSKFFAYPCVIAAVQIDLDEEEKPQQIARDFGKIFDALDARLFPLSGASSGPPSSSSGLKVDGGIGFGTEMKEAQRALFYSFFLIASQTAAKPSILQGTEDLPSYLIPFTRFMDNPLRTDQNWAARYRLPAAQAPALTHVSFATTEEQADRLIKIIVPVQVTIAAEMIRRVESDPGGVCFSLTDMQRLTGHFRGRKLSLQGVHDYIAGQTHLNRGRV
jgi:hypothetical protein